MKKLLLLTCLAFLLACGNNNKQKKETANASQDIEFESYKNHFIDKLWEANPDWASYAGLHKYDSIINIPNKENKKKNNDIYKALQTKLSAFKP